MRGGGTGALGARTRPAPSRDGGAASRFALDEPVDQSSALQAAGRRGRLPLASRQHAPALRHGRVDRRQRPRQLRPDDHGARRHRRGQRAPALHPGLSRPRPSRDSHGWIAAAVARSGNGRPATMRAGSVLLFGPYSVHGSQPNTSPRPRRTFINGFAYPGANARIYPGEGAGRLLRCETDRPD